MLTKRRISFRTGREIVKAGCATALHYSHLDRVIGRSRRLKETPTVLGYHRVVTDYTSASGQSINPNLISLDTFERQIDYLSKRYCFVSLDDLVTAFKEKRPHRNRLATITFDDGYADVYHNAHPILHQRRIPYTIFVVSDLVGTNTLLPHDAVYLYVSEALSSNLPSAFSDLSAISETSLVNGGDLGALASKLGKCTEPFSATRLILESLDIDGIRTLIRQMENQLSPTEDKRSGFEIVTWEMLSEMIEQGATVGSHTQSHVVLANESVETVRREVRCSKLGLEKRLKTQVNHFAYPDGSFNTNVIHEVASAGYCSAVTTCVHRDADQPLMTIPRLLLWEKSSLNGLSGLSTSVLSCQVNGIFDPAAKCPRDHWA